jgi:hypothetical protein
LQLEEKLERTSAAREADVEMEDGFNPDSLEEYWAENIEGTCIWKVKDNDRDLLEI